MVIEVPPEILNQRLQEMIKLWQKYMEYFSQGLESEELSSEAEKDFRGLQVEITRKCQYLSAAIPENLFDLWKDIKKLIVQTPSLEILKKEVPIRISNFRSQWHEVSIALNQKQGQLRTYLEDRERGAKKAKK